MRINEDTAKDGRDRRKHGYPRLLMVPLFAGGAWVDLADDRPLGYEHEAPRVALGAVEGRVLVCVFTGHEVGEELEWHVISLRDATKGATDAFHREAHAEALVELDGFAMPQRRRGDTAIGDCQKQEEVDGQSFRDLPGAKASISTSIDQVYNRQRLSSELDYLGPMEFEAQLRWPGAAAQHPLAPAETDCP